MVERRIIDVRPVDAGHQVLSVETDGQYRLRPCGGCPWRVDQFGQFPPGAFLQSARVAEDLATSTFGCHEAPPSRPRTCAGFIVAHREGAHPGAAPADRHR